VQNLGLPRVHHSAGWRVRWASRADVDGRRVASATISTADRIACGDWAGRAIVVTALDYDIGHDGNPHADYSVQVRDAMTFELLHTLSETVFAESLAVAGSKVTIGAFHGPDLLWDFATGEVCQARTVDGAKASAVSSSSEFEIVDLDNTTHPWATVDPIENIDAAGYFVCGHVPFTNDADRRLIESRVALVTSVVLDGRSAEVTVTFGGTVEVCDAQTGEHLLPSAALTGQLYSLGSLAVAGTRLLVPTDYQVEVLDLLTGEWLAPLRGFTSWAAVAAHGELVFTCGTGRSGAGVLCRWELDRPHVPAVGHLSRVNAVAFVGGYVVTGGDEGTVRRWAASDGTPAEPMAGHSGPVLAVTGVEVEGKPIAVSGGGNVNGGPDETLRRWDLEALTQWAPPIVAGHRGETQVLAARDRFIFSGGNGGRVSMWDVVTGAHLASQDGGYPVVGLVAGPDHVVISRMVFEKEPSIRWWPETGDVTALELPFGHVAAGMLVTVCFKEVMVWRGNGTGQVVDSGESEVTAIAVLGSEIVVARLDGSVRLVEGDLQLDLPCPARALAISPEGDIAVAFGSDVAVVTRDRPQNGSCSGALIDHDPSALSGSSRLTPAGSRIGAAAKAKRKSSAVKPP
jgi:WD40 repeat protein